MQILRLLLKCPTDTGTLLSGLLSMYFGKATFSSWQCGGGALAECGPGITHQWFYCTFLYWSVSTIVEWPWNGLYRNNVNTSIWNCETVLLSATMGCLLCNVSNTTVQCSGCALSTERGPCSTRQQFYFTVFHWSVSTIVEWPWNGLYRNSVNPLQFCITTESPWWKRILSNPWTEIYLLWYGQMEFVSVELFKFLSYDGLIMLYCFVFHCFPLGCFYYRRVAMKRFVPQ